MHGDDEIDIATIDLRSLTPQQWTALKRQVIRNAHAERSQVARVLFGSLFGWLRRSARTTRATATHDTGVSYRGA
jgi:hypothetical protein